MVTKQTLSKIGIGAWGLGGFAQHDPNNDDERQIKALTYTLQQGINFVEVNFWNSGGHSVEIIRQAVKQSKIPRDKLFFVQAIYNYNNPTIKDVEKEFEKCLEKLETDYIDSLEFPLTAVSAYGFEIIIQLVQKYLVEGKIRYTSVTNFNMEYLQKYQAIFQDKLFSHELCFNFEVRENEKLGITDFAKKNGIINVLYQPLRRNRTAKRNWPLLTVLTNKYGKTQNQIILNWLVSKGFYPLVKSENIEHIKENLAALEFSLEAEDIKSLNGFAVAGYKSPKIDWFMTGNGVKIHQIPNDFDSLYPENK